MSLTIDNSLIFTTMLSLEKKANELGCEIFYESNRKISFNTSMKIFIPPIYTLENLYALAHEMGHLIDYIDGKLDHNKWFEDINYRISAEMRAWINSYNLLVEVDAPLDNWKQHVQDKLFTYFEHEEIV